MPAVLGPPPDGALRRVPGRAEVVDGEGGGVDEVELRGERAGVLLRALPGEHGQHAAVGALGHLDDVPVAEGADGADGAAVEVEEAKAGGGLGARPLGPHHHVVVLGLVGFVGGDQGDGAAVGERQVVRDAAGPGGEGLGGAVRSAVVGEAYAVQLPGGGEEDRRRVRGPARGADPGRAVGQLPCRGATVGGHRPEGTGQAVRDGEGPRRVDDRAAVRGHRREHRYDAVQDRPCQDFALCRQCALRSVHLGLRLPPGNRAHPAAARDPWIASKDHGAVADEAEPPRERLPRRPARRRLRRVRRAGGGAVRPPRRLRPRRRLGGPRGTGVPAGNDLPPGA